MPSFERWPSPQPPIEKGPRQEENSRFGNKESIENRLDSLEDERFEFYGDSIDDMYGDRIPIHANVVETGTVKGIMPVVAHSDSGDILAVFKPVEGESESLRRIYGRTEFAPYEEMAYLTSEHFGFDLVAPTVYRSIGGRKGALQLLIDPDTYGSGGIVFPEDTYESVLYDNPDYRAMGALDCIMLNPDRHIDNILVEARYVGGGHSYEGPEPTARLIAIDHGLAGSAYVWNQYRVEQGRLGGFQGPLRAFTSDTRRTGEYEFRTERKAQPESIDAVLGGKIRQGIDKWSVFENKMRVLADKVTASGNSLEAKELMKGLPTMKDRARRLVDGGTYFIP